MWVISCAKWLGYDASFRFCSASLRFCSGWQVQVNGRLCLGVRIPTWSGSFNPAAAQNPTLIVDNRCLTGGNC